MNALEGIHVSMFAGVRGKTPADILLTTILEDIRAGRYAKQVMALRDLLKSNATCATEAKKRLDAFTISGTAKSRTEPGQHSNLLQGDVDELGSRLDEMRARLKGDRHVAFGFVSPGGQGLKLGIAIDGDHHAESFHAAAAYFLATYDVTLDPTCKDRLRLCFVSYDPELWINPIAIKLPLPSQVASKPTTTPTDSAASCVLNSCVTASLNDYTTGSLNHCLAASLHHKPADIVGNIRAREAALRALREKHPNLEALYLKLTMIHANST